MNIKMTREMKEDLVLFAIAVAGKKANTTRKKLDAFYLEKPILYSTYKSPFKYIRGLVVLKCLPETLRAAKIGMYTKLEHAFPFTAYYVDVDNLSVEILERIPGVGPKTSRFIMLYSDPTFGGAVLDTHILKYLRLLGYNTPKTTPTGKRYREFEDIFVARAKELGLTSKQLDDKVWRAYAELNGEETLKEYNLL